MVQYGFTKHKGRNKMVIMNYLDTCEDHPPEAHILMHNLIIFLLPLHLHLLLSGLRQGLLCGLQLWPSQTRQNMPSVISFYMPPSVFSHPTNLRPLTQEATTNICATVTWSLLISEAIKVVVECQLLPCSSGYCFVACHYYNILNNWSPKGE